VEEKEDKTLAERGFPVIYDQSMDLRRLMLRTLDKDNIRNINYDITEDRFKVLGAGVIRMVRMRVEPFLEEETSAQAAQRLLAAGHTLGNSKDLPSFLYDYPQEWAKWRWILAINEESRWRCYGSVFVMYAYSEGEKRGYNHCGFSDPVGCSEKNPNGVLVLTENVGEKVRSALEEKK